MVMIRVFGPDPPCAKCMAAERVVREVAQRFEGVTVEKYDVFSDEAEKYNIMMTPTIVVDDSTVEVGKVPSAEKLEKAVRKALHIQTNAGRCTERGLGIGYWMEDSHGRN